MGPKSHGVFWCFLKGAFGGAPDASIVLTRQARSLSGSSLARQFDLGPLWRGYSNTWTLLTILWKHWGKREMIGKYIVQSCTIMYILWKPWNDEGKNHETSILETLLDISFLGHYTTVTQRGTWIWHINGSTYPQHPWRIGNQEIPHFCYIWESWYPGNMVKTLFFIACIYGCSIPHMWLGFDPHLRSYGCITKETVTRGRWEWKAERCTGRGLLFVFFPSVDDRESFVNHVFGYLGSEIYTHMLWILLVSQWISGL